jgi:hypothetical protein
MGRIGRMARRRIMSRKDYLLSHRNAKRVENASIREWILVKIPWIRQR